MFTQSFWMGSFRSLCKTHSSMFSEVVKRSAKSLKPGIRFWSNQLQQSRWCIALGVKLLLQPHHIKGVTKYVNIARRAIESSVSHHLAVLSKQKTPRHRTLFKALCNKLPSPETSYSQTRGHLKPNIGEQLRLSPFDNISSHYDLDNCGSWQNISPLWKSGCVWGLIAPATEAGLSHALCLSGWPFKESLPVAARALVQWIRVGLDWFLDFLFTPPPLGMQFIAKPKCTKGFCEL